LEKPSKAIRTSVFFAQRRLFKHLTALENAGEKQVAQE
jgi:hypothetical protein